MMHSDHIRSMAKKISTIVVAHAAIYILYTYCHGKIDELFLLTEYLPISFIFCLAPLATAFFLSTDSARYGAVLLLGILPAELFFNVSSRFSAQPPFTIQEPALIWRILYEGSYGGILVLEVLAFWLTLKLLQELHQQIKTSAESPTENKLHDGESTDATSK